jgi:hypothetical protein
MFALKPFKFTLSGFAPFILFFPCLNWQYYTIKDGHEIGAEVFIYKKTARPHSLSALKRFLVVSRLLGLSQIHMQMFRISINKLFIWLI